MGYQTLDSLNCVGPESIDEYIYYPLPMGQARPPQPLSILHACSIYARCLPISCSQKILCWTSKAETWRDRHDYLLPFLSSTATPDQNASISRLASHSQAWTFTHRPRLFKVLFAFLDRGPDAGGSVHARDIFRYIHGPRSRFQGQHRRFAPSQE